jgi:hypothetical protein
MTDSPRSRVWRESKPFVGLLVVIVIYAIVRVSSATLAGSQGVLTPSGAVDKKLAALVLATFILRVVVLFVVPFVAIYRLVMRIAR